MRPDETIECCELMYVHKDIVEKVREEMPDEEEIGRASCRERVCMFV